MDYEGLTALLQQRRSIRAFKTDPVADDLVEKIVDSVRWAPSGMNAKPWKWSWSKTLASKARWRRSSGRH